MALCRISKEETVNSITHGVGALLGLFGTIYYLRCGIMYGTYQQMFCLLVFGLSLFLLYSFSTLYHLAAENTPYKQTLQKLDHSAIFLLIGGSYTPILAMSVGGFKGLLVLIIIWLIGLSGIFLELFNLMKSKKLSLSLYLIMGWMAIFVIKDIASNMPVVSFVLLISGGLFYTIGVYFYVKQAKPFYHGIWHIFVLLGSLSHYISVLILFFCIANNNTQGYMPMAC